MVVKRVYNNNVILAQNYQGDEIVLFGKGIGFQAKCGDVVARDKIQKKFEFKDETGFQFKKIIEEIPDDIIQLSDDLIIYIKEELKRPLSDSIYVTLTDHISNLLERITLGFYFDKSLLWNIKQLYPTEHRIGLECTKRIADTLHIKIEESEADYIALHIINSEIKTEMTEVYYITGVLNKISDIVKNNMTDIQTESYSFERFMIHCRFFVRNLIYETSNVSVLNEEEEVLKILKDKYPHQRFVVEEIKKMLSDDYEYEVSDEEAMYLLLHLIKLTGL